MDVSPLPLPALSLFLFLSHTRSIYVSSSNRYLSLSRGLKCRFLRTERKLLQFSEGQLPGRSHTQAVKTHAT